MASILVNVPKTDAWWKCIIDEFNESWTDDLYNSTTDVAVISNNEIVPCHQIILRAHSPMLKEKLRSWPHDSSTHELILYGVRPAVTKLLFTDYMYYGNVSIPVDLLPHTLEACDFLHLSELKAKCLSVAVDALKPCNVLDWKKLAAKMDLGNITTAATKLLWSSFREVTESKHFQQLDFEQLRKLLSDAADNGIAADDLLDATFVWFEYSRKERMNELYDVLEQLPLKECSIQCLTDKMNNHDVDKRFKAHKILARHYEAIEKGPRLRTC